MRNVTKGTVVRTIMLIIVMINMILNATGNNPINISESLVYEVIETLISVAVIIIGFWKNNSYTDNAQQADKYLEELRRFNEEE